MALKSGRYGANMKSVDWKTGKIKDTSYELPIASDSQLGGVKVGSRLSIDDNGVLSADEQSYTLPKASDSQLGGVKVGSGLSIDENGVLSASGGGGGSGIYTERILSQTVNLNQTGDYSYNVEFDVSSYNLNVNNYTFAIAVQSDNITTMSYIVPQGFVAVKTVYADGEKYATVYAMLWQMTTVAALDPTAKVYLHIIKTN